MNTGRYNIKVYLSNGCRRNRGFADKQERTIGRSKVVRKFPCGNFLPPEVKKERYMLPLFWNLHSKFYFMRASAWKYQTNEIQYKGERRCI